MSGAYVLDPSAIGRFGTSLVLGKLVAGAVVAGSTLLLPVLSYAEALASAIDKERYHILLGLRDRSAVTVLPALATDVEELAGGVETAGSLGAAHAAVEAGRHGAVLITADRATMEPELPDGWIILDVAMD
ncbi:MAG: hypothetical protein QOI74_1955 [Micromonosporaceae bacterium]|nr:hypothetical protein [Micromonosporaceae bacterium]MDT5036793.1 hypothetical protein [Micromonosporaceae bacterium]